MKIKLTIPDELPHGHGASFKKGIADALLESARSEWLHTPEGHNESREKGQVVGKEIAKLVSKIVKP
ncbi:hypothetical protein [Nitrosomonas sp. wSCUT-2]